MRLKFAALLLASVGLGAVQPAVAADLPVGIEMHKTADQPHVVTEAVSHFIRALAEAVANGVGRNAITLPPRITIPVNSTAQCSHRSLTWPVPP